MHNRKAIGKDTLLFLFLFGIQEVTINGNVIVHHILTKNISTTLQDMNDDFHMFSIITSSLFILVKNIKVEFEYKIFMCAVVGFFSTVYCIYNLKQVSSSALILFMYMIATYIIFIEPFFEKDLNKEFWMLIFNSGIKTIQLTIVIFGIGMALLRFFASNTDDIHRFNFLKTFIYSTVSVIAIIYMFLNWVLFPCWNKLISTHKSKKHNSKQIAATFRRR